MNVLAQLRQLFDKTLRTILTDPTPYASLVKPAGDARYGDYQANCAMPIAKELGKKPPEVARQIIAALDTGTMLEAPEVGGPGFINLRLRTDWLAAQLQKMAAADRLGIEPVAEPLTYVIDYSSPNVAKPMHVGHLRSTIIGDALARLLRFLGHKVIADNHLGDWGTQFGMILWGWKNHRDEDAYGRDPVGELARLYRLAATRIKPYEQLSEIRELEAKGRRAKAAEELKELLASSRMTLEELECRAEEGRPVAEASREETARLHAGDPENRALWRQFIPHCLGALRAIYERLEVHFDQWLGESAYDAMLPEVVADLRNKGLAEESDGALVVPVESVAVPFMVQKRDGAFNYGTSDLATIKYRKEHFNPDVMLYVVDHRQGDHFKALFEVADRWGYGGIVMEHVGFGTIMGQDKRPYKTREGDVVGLESLLDEAVYKALEVVNENSPELDLLQRRQVAEIVGIGAVKYADLSQNRTSDYVYDENKMLAMQGNTATYMQYAYARNRSIFSKANEDVAPYRTNPPLPILDTAHERALGMQLLRLHEALEAAAAEYKPNLITAYLWDLAKTYSGFFENCPVIRAETPELRRSRLLLCDLTARALRLCLTLLGIRTVERM